MTTSNGTELVLPNQLLAGYMAYEYLTEGMLFGQIFDSFRLGAVPLKAESESKRARVSSEDDLTRKFKRQTQGYVVVANLMRSSDTHIPGIINPLQLARWVQM